MKKLAAIGIIFVTVVACGQKKTEAALAAQKIEMEHEQLRDSISMVKQQEEILAEQEEAERRVEVVQHHTYATQSAGNAAQSVPEKKRLNNKVKGALIGAGVGAIAGAAVSKDQKGKGAIIGGVVGAGVGLGTGAVLDKRERERQEAEGN